MLRTDFEVIRNVYNLLQDSALSDENISFLLGKPNGYFFETLNPTAKSKFKQDLWALFVPIFQTRLDNILPPPSVGGTEEIKLSSAANYNKKSTIYRFTVTYEDRVEGIDDQEYRVSVEPESFLWKKSVVSGERKTENKSLTNFLKFMISEGYFFRPKTSLYIYHHLSDFFDQPFTIEDIAVSIKKLCRRQAGIETLLQRNIDHAHYTYSELFDISSLDKVAELPGNLRAMTSELKVSTRFKITHVVRGILGFIELNDRELVNIAVHPDFRDMRLASRLLDHVMALDKKSPLSAEVDIDSPQRDFLVNCSFTKSKQDREFKKENKLTVVKMKRGIEKEED